MKKDFELEPYDGPQIELELTDPVQPRVTRSRAPSTIGAAPTPVVAVPPGYTPERPRRRAAVLVGLVIGVLLLGVGGVRLGFPLPFFEPRDERFELKHWQRQIERKYGDQYAYRLSAPDGVERTLSCDRAYENGKEFWNCSCLEAGSTKRTARTQAREPKEAVDIARRAREMCGWPFWADCPRDHWLACKLLPR
jgi:hypothetical protein